jgi:hypothetical protein
LSEAPGQGHRSCRGKPSSNREGEDDDDEGAARRTRSLGVTGMTCTGGAPTPRPGGGSVELVHGLMARSGSIRNCCGPVRSRPTGKHVTFGPVRCSRPVWQCGAAAVNLGF